MHWKQIYPSLKVLICQYASICLLDRPTQLICIWIFVCWQCCWNLKDSAGRYDAVCLKTWHGSQLCTVAWRKIHEALRHEALVSLTEVNFLNMTSFRASIQQGWLQFREERTFGQLSLSSTMVSSMLPGSWAKVVVIIAAVFIISTVWLLQLNTSVRLVV